MAIGVFGLQVAYKLKRTELMSTQNTHGWFGGGFLNPGGLTSVDRIDFSNDTGTAVARGPLVSGRYRLAATGNINYGWFGGGGTTNPYFSRSTVDRIDFSNDSSTSSPRGPLGTFKKALAATGNSNYGWFGGGDNSGSTVDRIDFSNDSATSSLRGPLNFPSGNNALAATGNSNYGWFGGGFGSGAWISSVNRIDFSNDSPTASTRSPIYAARYLSATGNSNYGWFAAGNTPPSSAFVSTVQRIDFSNDFTQASTRGPLTSATGYYSATANSNYGYFGGGPATVDRINFSNDLATASPRGSLTVGRTSGAATSGQAKGPSIKLQKAGNYGWFGGGYSNPPQSGFGRTNYSTVDRIDFSNDLTTASVRGPLSQSKNKTYTTGNSNYGWFGGGSTSPSLGSVDISRVERIDFSNDSATASVRGPLTGTKYSGGATGNSNYAWFGGGFIPVSPFLMSTVERIDFSNDSPTASIRGPLSSASSPAAAVGNSYYGWFTNQRIDFSNDLATASVRGSLSAPRGSLAGTGNSNYGWFGGGNTGVSPSFTQHMSTVDRIDFSNDSVTASPRSSLTQARYDLAATGNSNYGWFSGGGSMPAGTFPWYTVYSTVERINFSNDLVSTSTRNPLSLARAMLKATSNSTR